MTSFIFTAEVPANIRPFLIPRLAVWIERNKQPMFGISTGRYGLVRFRRDPWPMYGELIVVAPARKVDLASLQNFSATF